MHSERGRLPGLPGPSLLIVAVPQLPVWSQQSNELRLRATSPRPAAARCPGKRSVASGRVPVSVLAVGIPRQRVAPERAVGRVGLASQRRLREGSSGQGRGGARTLLRGGRGLWGTVGRRVRVEPRLGVWPRTSARRRRSVVGIRARAATGEGVGFRAEPPGVDPRPRGNGRRPHRRSLAVRGIQTAAQPR